MTVRQLERQIARLQEKQASFSEDRIGELESKLHEKDAALRVARRERNALLAEQRNGARPEAVTKAQKIVVASFGGSPTRRSLRPLPAQCADPVEATPKEETVPWSKKDSLGVEHSRILEEKDTRTLENCLPPVQLDGLFSTVTHASMLQTLGTAQCGPSDVDDGTALLSRLSKLEKLTESLLDDL